MPSTYEFEWIVEQNPNIDWRALCISLIEDKDYYASDTFLEDLCMRMRMSKNYEKSKWGNKMLIWRWNSEFCSKTGNWKTVKRNFTFEQKLRTLMTFIESHLLEMERSKLGEINENQPA